MDRSRVNLRPQRSCILHPHAKRVLGDLQKLGSGTITDERKIKGLLEKWEVSLPKVEGKPYRSPPLIVSNTEWGSLFKYSCGKDDPFFTTIGFQVFVESPISPNAGESEPIINITFDSLHKYSSVSRKNKFSSSSLWTNQFSAKLLGGILPFGVEELVPSLEGTDIEGRISWLFSTHPEQVSDALKLGNDLPAGSLKKRVYLHPLYGYISNLYLFNQDTPFIAKGFQYLTERLLSELLQRRPGTGGE